MAEPIEDVLIDRCRSLLETRAEGAQVELAEAILAGYRERTREQRVTFLGGLGVAFDPDPDVVQRAARRWARAAQSGGGDGRSDAGALAALLRAAEPPRRQLLRRLHLPSGATSQLVSWRADLLAAVEDHPELRRVDLDLRYLLRSWFTRSFLELRRIDWATPAFILERIATNEGVHEVSDWLDLRARVRPPDRRCYGFFHPAMPDEPLIFVMVALTRSLPTTISEVLETDRRALPTAEARMAVFYSISNCQPGLRGVSLGNFLIKQVASTLSADLPQLTEFVTLSPVNGLADWVTAQPADRELASTTARYLLTALRGDGQPLDPIARFHLGNGASLDRILPAADLSERGRERAFGAMASYRYDLNRVTDNHDAYATDRTIAHSPAVDALLG